QTNVDKQRRKLHDSSTKYLNQNPARAKSLIEALYRWGQDYAPASDIRIARELERPENEAIRKLHSDRLKTLNVRVKEGVEATKILEDFALEAGPDPLLQHIADESKLDRPSGRYRGFEGTLKRFAREHELPDHRYSDLLLAYLKHHLGELVKLYG